MAQIISLKTAKVKSDQGLAQERQNDVVNRLRILLADEAVLYTRLRNYQWNATEVNFYSLHMTFESQLDGIAAAMDEVSKCIHQYGSYVQTTIDKFVNKARLGEELGAYHDARTMVANLATDHETIIQYLHEEIKKIDYEPGDVVGEADVLTTLLHQHQKMAWMLHMYLED
jgi:starvation-inducible DNA-binding protein